MLICRMIMVTSEPVATAPIVIAREPEHSRTHPQGTGSEPNPISNEESKSFPVPIQFFTTSTVRDDEAYYQSSGIPPRLRYLRDEHG